MVFFTQFEVSDYHGYLNTRRISDKYFLLTVKFLTLNQIKSEQKKHIIYNL